MPILRPDIYDHNNPIYPVVNTNSTKGATHILPYTVTRDDLGTITYTTRKEIPIRHLIEGQLAIEWDTLEAHTYRLIDISLHDLDEGWMEVDSGASSTYEIAAQENANGANLVLSNLSGDTSTVLFRERALGPEFDTRSIIIEKGADDAIIEIYHDVVNLSNNQLLNKTFTTSAVLSNLEILGDYTGHIHSVTATSRSLSLTDLADVDTTGELVGDILRLDVGNIWKPVTIDDLGGGGDDGCTINENVNNNVLTASGDDCNIIGEPSFRYEYPQALILAQSDPGDINIGGTSFDASNPSFLNNTPDWGTVAPYLADSGNPTFDDSTGIYIAEATSGGNYIFIFTFAIDDVDISRMTSVETEFVRVRGGDTYILGATETETTGFDDTFTYTRGVALTAGDQIFMQQRAVVTGDSSYTAYVTFEQTEDWNFGSSPVYRPPVLTLVSTINDIVTNAVEGMSLGMVTFQGIDQGRSQHTKPSSYINATATRTVVDEDRGATMEFWTSPLKDRIPTLVGLFNKEGYFIINPAGWDEEVFYSLVNHGDSYLEGTLHVTDTYNVAGDFVTIDGTGLINSRIPEDVWVDIGEFRTLELIGTGSTIITPTGPQALDQNLSWTIHSSGVSGGGASSGSCSIDKNINNNILTAPGGELCNIVGESNLRYEDSQELVLAQSNPGTTVTTATTFSAANAVWNNDSTIWRDVAPYTSGGTPDFSAVSGQYVVPATSTGEATKYSFSFTFEVDAVDVAKMRTVHTRFYVNSDGIFYQIGAVEYVDSVVDDFNNAFTYQRTTTLTEGDIVVMQQKITTDSGQAYNTTTAFEQTQSWVVGDVPDVRIPEVYLVSTMSDAATSATLGTNLGQVGFQGINQKRSKHTLPSAYVSSTALETAYAATRGATLEFWNTLVGQGPPVMSGMFSGNSFIINPAGYSEVTTYSLLNHGNTSLDGTLNISTVAASTGNDFLTISGTGLVDKIDKVAIWGEIGPERSITLTEGTGIIISEPATKTLENDVEWTISLDENVTDNYQHWEAQIDGNPGADIVSTGIVDFVGGTGVSLWSAIRYTDNALVLHIDTDQGTGEECLPIVNNYSDNVLTSMGEPCKIEGENAFRFQHGQAQVIRQSVPGTGLTMDSVASSIGLRNAVANASFLEVDVWSITDNPAVFDIASGIFTAPFAETFHIEFDTTIQSIDPYKVYKIETRYRMIINGDAQPLSPIIVEENPSGVYSQHCVFNVEMNGGDQIVMVQRLVANEDAIVVGHTLTVNAESYGETPEYKIPSIYTVALMGEETDTAIGGQSLGKIGFSGYYPGRDIENIYPSAYMSATAYSDITTSNTVSTLEFWGSKSWSSISELWGMFDTLGNFIINPTDTYESTKYNLLNRGTAYIEDTLYLEGVVNAVGDFLTISTVEDPTQYSVNRRTPSQVLADIEAAHINHTHSYDNYEGWVLRVDSNVVNNVASGNTVNFVSGTNVTLQAFGDDVIISSSGEGNPITPDHFAGIEYADYIELYFNADVTHDHYEIYSSEVSATEGFKLIAVIPKEDIVAGLYYKDYTYTVKGNVWYRAYGIKQGTISPSAAAVVTTVNEVADVTLLELVSDAHHFHVQWENPQDRRLDHVEVRMDSQAIEGNLNESNAVLIYSGLRDSLVKAIPIEDIDNFIQVWVKPITRTNI